MKLCLFVGTALLSDGLWLNRDPQYGSTRQTAQYNENGVTPVRNPYTTQVPFRFVDDLYPVAPESQLGHGELEEGAGTANKWYSFTKGSGYYVHVPDWQFAKAFPADGDAGAIPKDGAQLKCTSDPTDFKDKDGHTCDSYASKNWCKVDGTEGDGWAKPGKITDHANSDKINAAKACCACGGGEKVVIMGNTLVPLNSNRQIHAPGDRLPLRYYPLTNLAGAAAEDNISMPVAKADWIPDQYRKYFSQLHARDELFKTEHGLSTEFFGIANTPADLYKTGYEPKDSAVFTRVDPFVDFRRTGNHLLYPLLSGEPDIWWVRFSGTLEIVVRGDYAFDMPVGAMGSQSALILDGKPVMTPGQCNALGNSEEECTNRGCTFQADPAPGVCVMEEIPIVQLEEGGHCIEGYLRVKKRDNGRTLAMRYMGPDTQSKMVTIPSPALNCNPLVKSTCMNPEVDACGKKEEGEVGSVQN